MCRLQLVSAFLFYTVTVVVYTIKANMERELMRVKVGYAVLPIL